MMGKYRKRPVEIEAVEWQDDFIVDGEDTAPAWVKEAFGNGTLRFGDEDPWELYVDTLEGRMLVSVGDYIVKGVKGELYPCKPDVFAMTYEEAHDTLDWKRSVVRANDLLNDIVSEEACGNVEIPNVAYSCISTAAQSLATVEGGFAEDVEELR